LETHQGLGHMTLSYPEALQRSQITEIEELTGLLFSPLCNALTHQRALNAALKDSLTGLGNRSALLPTLHQEFEFARRHNLPLSLLALDIDHFKAINDTYGHPIGDHYLRHFSSVLQKTVRDSDLSYRIGGEEFVVLLRNTDTLGAMKLASRLTQAIRSAALTHQDQSILTTTSIGVATYTPNETPESLLERADQALYHAKHQGRDRVSHLNFQGEPSNG
jgi:diguanylate cyclase (GGDEF)-like protein